MNANVYVGYGDYDWEVATYINDNYDEAYSSFHQLKKDAMKELTKVKKQLFKDEGVNEIIVKIDYDGGLESVTKTFTKR